jgi:putative NADPH-quinone reductase
MAVKVAVIQGHPDPAAGHLGHALAEAYAQGAARGGHDVRRIEVARLDFPLLRSEAEFATNDPPPGLMEAQAAVLWADHYAIFFPLWLGTMPALLKAFLEQVLRPGLTFEYSPRGFPKGLLGGKSARIVVTMGMPAFLYRWYFGAFGVRVLERSILGFTGVGPIRRTLLGGVAAADEAKRKRWIDSMGEFGRRGR